MLSTRSHRTRFSLKPDSGQSSLKDTVVSFLGEGVFTRGGWRGVPVSVLIVS